MISSNTCEIQRDMRHWNTKKQGKKNLRIEKKGCAR